MAKRQKRLVVLSSDEDDSKQAEVDELPLSQQPSKALSQNALIRPVKRAAPRRPRAKLPPKAAVTSPGPAARQHVSHPRAQTSKPILELLAATAQPRPNGQQSKAKAPERYRQVGEVDEDDIEDDSPVEWPFSGVAARSAARTIPLSRKEKLPSNLSSLGSIRPEDKRFGGSQKFKAAEKSPERRAGRKHSIDESASGLRPWAEKYGPSNLEELVVHKKKVSDVRRWLEHVIQGQSRKRLLVLKGPSGAGKTATVSLLSQTLKYETSEWKNPVGSDYSSESYQSMSAQFGEFMGRSGKFNRLVMTGAASQSAEPLSSRNSAESSKARLILIEEFPNTILSTSSALLSFRLTINQYLATQVALPVEAASSTPGGIITPIIMIITETRASGASSSNDDFTAHKLLGSDILGHPLVSVIEFNPVAPTLLKKALELVIQKEARQSGRRKVPGPLLLKQLGEVGDVRSAIGSLEFLYLRGNGSEDWSGSAATRSRKSANEGPRSTMLEPQSFETVTQRESNFSLFHAVGKVVYNKRKDPTQLLPQPPGHMSDNFRSRMPLIAVEDLFGATGTDTETFIAALHENFVPSCEGASFMDSLNGSFHALSDSDVLASPRSTGFGVYANHRSRSFQGNTSETLRQDEICFHLAVSGLLFALPNPVKRPTHPTTGRGAGKRDAHKMFYPTSMRLARQMEEIGSLVDQWINHLRHGTSRLHKPPSNQSISAPALTKDTYSSSLSNQGAPNPMRTSLACTKAELVLERLPYLAVIQKQISTFPGDASLERITSFQAFNLGRDENSEGDQSDEGEASTLSRMQGIPWMEASRGPVVEQAQQQGKEALDRVSSGKADVEKLYLSEDDIED